METKEGQRRKALSISVSTGASCSLFRPWRTAYSTERSAPIPDSNPASRTGRVLSHLSILVSLYAIRAIKAISIIPSPQVRAYFRSFTGRNQFKKVRSRPLKSRRGKKTYAKDCRVCSSLFQFAPKKLEQDFSVFTCGFARFAESCSNSVFRIGTGFLRVYLRFCAFVPIVPVFNKSYIYIHI